MPLAERLRLLLVRLVGTAPEQGSASPLRSNDWIGCVFGVTLIIYALLTPRVLTRLDPATGDEPFYMMTAHNLLAGRGLDETLSWARADYLEFYPPSPLPADWSGWPAFPVVLPPHVSEGTVPPGLYSKHGLGLSLLIAPLYALGKRLAIVLLLECIGSLVAVNIFLLAWETTGSAWVGAAVWLAMSFSNPIMSYAFLIFPEIVAALLIVYAFRRIRQSTNNAWQTAGIGLSIALLPWLHVRFALVAVALGAYWIWAYFWKPPVLPRTSVLPLLLPSVSAAILLDFYLYLYGSFLPNMEDHGGTSDALGALWAAGGLFLDQQWGLLIYAPIYLLAIAGIPLLFRFAKTEMGWWLAILMPYLVLIAAYKLWWGEWCPPARYLTAILPLFAAPLGLVLRHARFWLLTAATSLLAAVGWGMIAIFMWDPQLMYNQPTGKSEAFSFLQRLAHVDLTALVPSYVQPAWSDNINWAWLVGLVLLVTLLAIGLVLISTNPSGEKLQPNDGTQLGSPLPLKEA